MNLTDLLGNNDAAWMMTPGRPCAAPSDKALDIRYHADQWFPSHHMTEEYARAKCAGCPVQTQCLAYGMDNPDLEGILGGVTENGRKRLRKGAAA